MPSSAMVKPLGIFYTTRLLLFLTQSILLCANYLWKTEKQILPRILCSVNSRHSLPKAKFIVSGLHFIPPTYINIGCSLNITGIKYFVYKRITKSQYYVTLIWGF